MEQSKRNWIAGYIWGITDKEISADNQAFEQEIEGLPGEIVVGATK